MDSAHAVWALLEITHPFPGSPDPTKAGSLLEKPVALATICLLSWRAVHLLVTPEGQRSQSRHFVVSQLSPGPHFQEYSHPQDSLLYALPSPKKCGAFFAVLCAMKIGRRYFHFLRVGCIFPLTVRFQMPRSLLSYVTQAPSPPSQLLVKGPLGRASADPDLARDAGMPAFNAGCLGGK